MSNNFQNILDEEFKLLIRATRNELFHFISVQYNHYDLVRKVKKDLVAQYPNRPVHSFNLDNCNPETFIHEILASKSGLVFIEKFDLMFTEPFRSLCIGFNQRRDLFSTFPIQIIVFIPSGEENLQNFQKAMPDVFSIVNPIIQLFMKIEVNKSILNRFENGENNFANIEEAKGEIKRIEKRLKSIKNVRRNANFIVFLKTNLASSYRFLGDYIKSKSILEETLSLIDSDKNLDFETEKATIQNDLALIYMDLGNFEEARKLLEKAMFLDEKNYGINHPVTANRYSNLASVLFIFEDYKNATLLLEKAYKIYISHFGDEHSSTKRAKENLDFVEDNVH